MPQYPVSNRMIERQCDAFLMHYLPSLDPGLDARARHQARVLEDRIAERACLFLATGRGLAAVLRERYPGVHSFVCEPGVDAVFSRPRPRAPGRAGDPINLLTVANLVPAKGHRELAMILQGLTDRNWVWHLVGSLDTAPEFTGEFVRLAAGLIESSRIVFHRKLTTAALARLMSRMDVFVSASHFESYGMALAEAVAAGVPVVATRVGEANRIVGDVANADLVPVGAWDAFAAALTAMMDATVRRVSVRCLDRERPVRSWDDAFADFSTACRTAAGNLEP